MTYRTACLNRLTSSLASSLSARALRGMLMRGIIYALIVSLACPAPILASGLTPDAAAPDALRPSVGAAQNGVPLVDIAKPNANGLSHNQYSDFNVQQQGVILNNSAKAGLTQLGGGVLGNPNLQGGPGASTILNEVTSSNRSHIEGYIEVHGRKADVILSNPNGVTVNGGGFINVPQATITTGTPVIHNGQLQALEVRQGDILITGKGMNTSNVDAFSLISHTAAITADVHANSLNITTGRNLVDKATGQATALAPTPEDAGQAKPTVSLDSSLLGGMYAQRIRLTSTEKGVGVNLQGAVQAADSLQITADGKLSLREASSGGNMQLASSGDMVLGETVYAGNNMQLATDKTLQSTAAVGANGNVTVQAQQLELNNAVLAAGVNRNGAMQSAGLLQVQTRQIKAENSQIASGGDANLYADTMETRQTGIGARGDLVLQGTSLSFTDGRIASGNDLILLARTATIDATMSASNFLSMDVAEELLLEARATLLAKQGMELLADTVHNKGFVFSESTLRIGTSTATKNTDGGNIVAMKDILFEGRNHGTRAGLVYNASGVIESLDGSIGIFANRLENSLGPVSVAQRIIYKDYWSALTFVYWGFAEDDSFIFTDDSNRYSYKHMWSDEIGVRMNATNAIYGTPYEYPEKDGRVFQEWIVTREEYIDAPFTPTTLSARNDLIIDALEVLNDKATMAAGNNISIKADYLTNKGLELSLNTNISRYFLHISDSNKNKGNSLYSYDIREVYDTLPGLILANGIVNLEITNTFINEGIKAGESYLGEHSGTMSLEGVAALKGSGLPAYDLPLPAPGGSLFRLSADPGHKYRIETNPALADMGNFYGSEYFLSAMGLDLTALNRRLLGDAFYETRLVTEQIMKATGQKTLTGMGSDTEQMRALMDNAADQGQALGLMVGLGLTAEQVAALTKDIVWLEERQVEGETVLVPVLYLAQATKDTLHTMRGATVSGGSVQVAAQTVSNSGAINGGGVDIAVRDLFNRGGTLSGGQYVAVNAANDIINHSGTIKGPEVLLAAGNNIAFTTHTQTERTANTTQTGISQQAGISSSGNVLLAAGNNITLSGATFDVAGKTAMQAGNDIEVGATRLEATHTYSRGSDSTVKHLGSTILSGQLEMTAGRDMTVLGSNIAATGDASLNAGRNVTIASVVNEEHHSFKESGSSGGKKRNREEQSDTYTNQGSSILAGGNLTVQAGGNPAYSGETAGNITVVGSALGSGATTTLKAENDVLITSAQNTHSESSSYSKKGAFSAQTSKHAAASVTQVGSSISGTDVNIAAGENVLISASRVDAKNDLSVKAERGDVVVAAAQDTAWDYSETKKSKTNIGNIASYSLLMTATVGTALPFVDSEFWSKTTEKNTNSSTTNVGSLLTAGNNLRLDAGRDVSVIGSAAYADNNLGIFAGRDVNLIPGREQSSSSYSKKKESIGIKTSFSLDNISTFAGYSSVEQGVTRTGDYTAGSYTGAGNDVFISAGRDLNQVGSHIEAGRDVNIEAGQDWNMTASFDRETLHQYVKTVEAGITASARQNVTSAAQSLIDLPQNATAGKGNAGYKGLTAASAGLQAIDSVKGALSEYASVSAKVGGATSKTSYSSSASSASPSTVSAGRDINAWVDRDILIEGGQIFAGRDIWLDAGRDLTVTSAKNTGSSNFDSSSAGGGIGVKATYGPNGAAFGVNVSANVSGAGSKDSYLSHTNSLIVAGDTLYTSSGRDTTVAGAHLEADKVWMDVGRDLTVASLQDQYDSNNFSWNAGANVTVGYGIAVSGNAGMGQGKTESDWVGQQTSIVGKSEVDIYTEGNTHLKGAIIATNPGGDLTLNTGTLTLEEIQDKDKGYNWGLGVSGGFSVGGIGFDKDSQLGGMKPIDNTSGGSKAPYLPNSVDLTYASHDKEGVLRPTVTEGEIVVRNDPDMDLSGLNRDLNNAREVTKDEESYVHVYVSPGAIKEIADGFVGIKKSLSDIAKDLKELLAVQESLATEQGKQQAIEKLGEQIEDKFSKELPALTKEQAKQLAESIIGEYDKEYKALIQSGMSPEEAARSLDNGFKATSAWLENIQTNGVTIVTVGGMSYLQLPNFYQQAAVAETSVAAGVAGVVGVMGMIALYQQIDPQAAAVMAEGLKNSLTAVNSNLNDFAVAYLPGYGAMTKQTTIQDQNGIKTTANILSQDGNTAVVQRGSTVYHAYMDVVTGDWIFGEAIPGYGQNNNPQGTLPPYIPQGQDNKPLTYPGESTNIGDYILVNIPPNVDTSLDGKPIGNGSGVNIILNDSYNGVWSTGPTSNGTANAVSHWEAHKEEFPNINSVDEYVAQAQKLISPNTSEGVVSKTVSGGREKAYYDTINNIFVKTNAQGEIKTMFKPTSSTYYDRQK